MTNFLKFSLSVWGLLSGIPTETTPLGPLAARSAALRGRGPLQAGCSQEGEKRLHLVIQEAGSCSISRVYFGRCTCEESRLGKGGDSSLA